ncbi:TolB-like translocation protein [Neobacillus dielmonensis]|uniref:hypothetical protein n=1 Tax=Neobacillus dielmonensis TaxID=1347369 RepID=UPI0006936280|nr:hypothetical protein [Neobacillus dielmonensis]
MLRKITLILIIGVLLPIYQPIHAQPADKEFKAAFIRNNDLWIKIGNEEWPITNGDYIRYPKWSYDGTWVAYQKRTETENGNGQLWVYYLKQRKHFLIHENASPNFQWAPRRNTLGFLTNHTLSVVTAQLPKPLRIQHMDKKVDNFSWLPKGNGFLVSKKATNELHSDIHLLKVYLYRKPSVQHFYTIPVGKDEYYVGTSPFKWSQDHKWISFLLTPTASLSADSNTLCLLSDNGRAFQKVDEMLSYQDWYKWAPTQRVIGYIEGTGREAISNKKLKVLDVVQFYKTSQTPSGFADRGLSWATDLTLFVSRSKESEWTKLEERPLPRLYKVGTDSKSQKQITFPNKNEGDFAPDYYRKHLFWIRTNRKTATIYLANASNLKETYWIKNINVASNYYERWNWDEVFSLYKRGE